MHILVYFFLPAEDKTEYRKKMHFFFSFFLRISDGIVLKQTSPTEWEKKGLLSVVDNLCVVAIQSLPNLLAAKGLRTSRLLLTTREGEGD